MKASLSSARRCVRAAFWIAVGVLRERDVRRWVARVGERPRVVKCEAPSGRGAFEGSGTEASLGLCSLGLVLEVGFDVKREEMTSVFGVVGCWLWDEDVLVF